MTKRKRRFCRTLRFYNEDIFGRLVIKDPKDKRNLHLGYKNAKINNLLYERKEEQIERWKRIVLGLGVEKFAYRTDIVKVRKKRRKKSSFGSLLKIRLIIRKFASEMTVRQFRSYIKRAVKGSFIFLRFISFLEKRIDFVTFRMNFFQTSGEARQNINHGNILLNGKVCFFPSTQVNFYDVISVVNKPLIFKKLINYFKSKLIFRSLPSYIEVNYRILSSTFVFNPKPSKTLYPSRDVNRTVLSSKGKRFKR
jgi:ribosomal protein S4